MTEWVTIKVPKEDRDKAKDYQPDDATYGDCLVAGAERLNEHLDSDTSRFGSGVTREELEDILNQISMANEPTVELDTQEIIGRLEDLRAELPKEVAREVHQR